MNWKTEIFHTTSDNYLYTICNDSHYLMIDPGDSTTVPQVMQQMQLAKKQLAAVLITHHHADHIDALPLVLQAHSIPTAVPVYGPEHIAGVSVPVQATDNLEIYDRDNQLIVNMQVIATPGHTLDHLSYYHGSDLFCADTLFIAGCGRLFEGDAQMMQDSFDKLFSLPEDTKFYCGHEYTLSNLKFAAAVEPDNQDIQQATIAAQALLAQAKPTIPGTLAQEKKINPYARTRIQSVIDSASNHCGEKLSDPAQVFAVLREWKNNF